MKKKDVVFETVKESFHYDEFISALQKNKVTGLEAQEVSEKAGLMRSNASSLLNRLVDERKLIKITGRPVLFIAREPLEAAVKHTLVKTEYSIQDLRDFCCSSSDPFSKFTGYDTSMKEVINQAKAAIMYPPGGIHTIISGPRGCGKTVFAKSMYEYAKGQKKKNADEYVFVELNNLMYSDLVECLKKMKTLISGVLFIDDASGLPKVLQERLIHYMESTEWQENVFIILALPEGERLNQSVAERFPITLKLPSLTERSWEERFRLIKLFFSKEAVRIKRPMKIASEVVQALMAYECSGDIKQLKADIKMICADVFFQNLHKTDNKILEVNFGEVPGKIRADVLGGKKISSKNWGYLQVIDSDILIRPSEYPEDYPIPKFNIYSEISRISEKLKREGRTEAEITEVVQQRLKDYFAKISDSILDFRSVKRELKNSLPEDVVDFTIEILEKASMDLGKAISAKLAYALAFHINYLILRSKMGHQESEQTKRVAQEQGTKENQAARMIASRISERFTIAVQEKEVAFLTELLKNQIPQKRVEDKVRIMIIAHGEHVATSMADAVNTLMMTDLVYGFDIPVNVKHEDVFENILNIAKAINKGSGILLMVDMGSLANLEEKITAESGIFVKTIERVSTIYVIEAVRRILYKEETLEEIYQEVLKLQSVPYQMEVPSEKQPIVITTCSSGVGTGIMLKERVERLMREERIEGIAVEALGYQEILKQSRAYEEIVQRYEVIACIGNMNPGICSRFYDLSTILSEENLNVFADYLRQNQGEQKADPYKKLEKILEEHVTYFNVHKSMRCFEEFFSDTVAMGFRLSNNGMISVAMHLSYMIERIISRVEAKFSDHTEKYVVQNRELYQNLANAVKTFERVFKITISDHEICFLCEIFLNLNKINQ